MLRRWFAPVDVLLAILRALFKLCTNQLKLCGCSWTLLPLFRLRRCGVICTATATSLAGGHAYAEFPTLSIPGIPLLVAPQRACSRRWHMHVMPHAIAAGLCAAELERARAAGAVARQQEAACIVSWSMGPAGAGLTALAIGLPGRLVTMDNEFSLF